MGDHNNEAVLQITPDMLIGTNQKSENEISKDLTGVDLDLEDIEAENIKSRVNQSGAKSFANEDPIKKRLDLTIFKRILRLTM